MQDSAAEITLTHGHVRSVQGEGVLPALRQSPQASRLL